MELSDRTPDESGRQENPVEFSIDRFQPHHRSQVIEISMRAWEPVFAGLKPAVPDYVYDAFYPCGWRARQTADIEEFLSNEGEHVWVATHAGAVLGWVGIRLHQKDNMGEIYILAVDPRYQRRGVGRALIDHAVRQMRQAGMAIAMIETGDDPGHASSRATYERTGFERWPVARYFRKL